MRRRRGRGRAEEAERGREGTQHRGEGDDGDDGDDEFGHRIRELTSSSARATIVGESSESRRASPLAERSPATLGS